jgi:predicted enzyme related to lactoylglutathione lyase
MNTPNNHINYVEFKAKDLEEIKLFYTQVFGWVFTDYGPGYVAFAESGIAGGFEKTDQEIVNGALVVIHHNALEEAREAVLQAKGKITVDIFTFPGGRRFQFLDPSGNELSVWTEG